jgi:hypothetical protein
MTPEHIASRLYHKTRKQALDDKASAAEAMMIAGEAYRQSLAEERAKLARASVPGTDLD